MVKVLAAYCKRMPHGFAHCNRLFELVHFCDRFDLLLVNQNLIDLISSTKGPNFEVFGDEKMNRLTDCTV